jgi:hypothetical protein
MARERELHHDGATGNRGVPGSSPGLATPESSGKAPGFLGSLGSWLVPVDLDFRPRGPSVAQWVL